MEMKWGKTQKIESGQGGRRHKTTWCRRIQVKRSLCHKTNSGGEISEW